MSNPGVIILTEALIGDNILRVEDNIGEAIHIHFGNIRIDLSIKEFEKLVNDCVSIVEKMIGVDEFRFCDYDAIFLSNTCNILLELKEVIFRNINVSEFRTNQFNGEYEKFVPIRESRVIKAIKGNFDEVNGWQQKNYIYDTNKTRVEENIKNIKNYGYRPELFGSYVVVLDGGNIIADGCHRVSVLLEEDKTQSVTVADWITRHSGYCDSAREKEILLKNKSLKSIEMEAKFEDSEKKYVYKPLSNIIRKRRIRYTKRYVKKVIKDTLKGKKIIIKGAGVHTVELVKILKKCGNIEILGIMADEIKDKNLKKFNRIMSLNNLADECDYIVISSFKYRTEMKQELREIIPEEKIYDLYDYGITHEFFS